MGGQRHSKNAGTMGVEGLTYHEKKALGFGTVKQRLGKVRLSGLFPKQIRPRFCCMVSCVQHTKTVKRRVQVCRIL